MAAETTLFDFVVDAAKTSDSEKRQEIVQLVRSEFENVFPQLELAYQMAMKDGNYYVLVRNKEAIITCRIFEHGLVTINIEYYLEAEKKTLMDGNTTKLLENGLAKKFKVCSGQVIPAMKRGDVPRYFQVSDDRIIEYDIDRLVYETWSPFQKIQIFHSKTYGNMLILDEFQNIAESDLIYTETLMGRGIENYEGKEICILGGGDGALLYELLKENPKNIIMLEIDETVMQVCNKYLKSICGDVLAKRKDDNYEIIVGDCVEYLKKFFAEGRKFDYVIADLTDIPISDGPFGVCWSFIRTILEHSFKILKPDGKYLTHGNGTMVMEYLAMFEDQLKQLKPKVKFTTSRAFVPSYMEEWLFYQITFA